MTVDQHPRVRAETRVPNLRAACYLGGPVLMFGYGIARFVDGTDGDYGPGTAWTAGHLLFIGGLLLFAATIVGLRRQAQVTGGRRVIADVATAAGLVGIAAFIRVVVIDIIVGAGSADHAAMPGVSARYEHAPDVLPAGLYDALHNLAPILFGVSLVALLILAARQGRFGHRPILVVIGFVMLGADLALLPVAATLLGLALVPAAFPRRRPAVGRPATAAGRAERSGPGPSAR